MFRPFPCAELRGCGLDGSSFADLCPRKAWRLPAAARQVDLVVCGSCREREASGKREVREAGSVTNVQQSVRRGQRVAGECCSRSRRSPSASTQGRRSPDENSRDCNLDRRRTGTTSQAQRRACIDRASARTISARGNHTHARLFGLAFLRCRHVSVRRLPWPCVPASASFLERRRPRQIA